jgi:drug/metabolite transporter (DMT)-like permease
MLPAFLTTILFSISAVCANRTIRFMGGTEANFWRLPIAALLLGLYAHTLGAGLGGGAFQMFFLSGLVGFGFGDLALFQALPRLGSRLTVLMVHCLASPLAALIEWLWLGTTLTRGEIFSAITILAGVSLALAPGDHLNLERKHAVAGVLFGLVAAFGQGFGAVLSRKAFQVAALAGGNIDGITAAYQRIIGGSIVAGIFLLVVKRNAIFKDRKSEPTADFSPGAPGNPPLTPPKRGTKHPGLLPSLGEVGGGSPQKRSPANELNGATFQKWRASWLWILLNAVAGPALGVSCYQWALKLKGSGVVLPIVAITPLVIIPLSQRMEGEKPTYRSLIGSLIAVIGAVALALVQ